MKGKKRERERGPKGEKNAPDTCENPREKQKERQAGERQAEWFN